MARYKLILGANEQSCRDKAQEIANAFGGIKIVRKNIGQLELTNLLGSGQYPDDFVIVAHGNGPFMMLIEYG